MRLNSSELYLGLMQDVLTNILAPELSSDSAKTAAAIMQNTFAELQRREKQAPDILVKANIEGLSLISVMQQAIIAHGLTLPELKPIPQDQSSQLAFSVLLAFNSDITEQLNVLARLLSAIPPQARAANINLLLQQAGNWEHQLHIDLLQPQSSDVSGNDSPNPLPFNVLENFIKSVHPDGEKACLLTMERAEGGSGKQTFFITIAGADNLQHELVVRKADKVLMMTSGAYLIEREYILLKIVAEEGYLAPRPLWFGHNVAGTDGDFFIMERAPGKIPGTFLGGAEAIPETFTQALPVLLAQLHNIPLSKFTHYIDQYEKSTLLTETIEQCTRRTVEEWKAYAQTANQLASPALTYMMDWLSRNVPKNNGKPVLVHGDYNSHNMLMHEDKVSAILDWEGAMFGAPELDLAYIRPHISKHINWDRFVALYREAGGPEIDETALDYYQAVLGMRVIHGLCAATKNLQDHSTDDYRIIMVQLGYVLDFMQRGLGVCQEP